MKRLIIPGLVILVILGLVNWGNRILEQILDVELPKLLTRELGIPVTLSPIRAQIPQLMIYSPRLVMGDPDNPALAATGVTVSLDFSDLLHGEIRLRRASGVKLMVKPSLWPSNDDPRPTNYRFLDPYLPDYLEFDSAGYVDADGDRHIFTSPQWRRQSPGATLNWLDDRGGQAVDITIGLSSLSDLLRLARIKLQITTAASGKDDSTIDMSLEIQPGKQSGYDLTARIKTAGMTATVTTGSNNAWELPVQSTTSVQQLDIGKVQTLAKNYRGDIANEGFDALQALPLPRLSLPAHKGHVTIEKLRWQDELGTNGVFDFVSGPEGVSIPALSCNVPAGILHGQLSISSSDNGWQLGFMAKLVATETDKSLAAPYLDAAWFWGEGSSQIRGQGETWGTLLNSLQGDIALSGSHHGAVVTPVAITAKLDNRPGEFALDMIEVTLAQGRITGSATLAGDEQMRLTGKIRAEQLNLDFLLPKADPDASRGMQIPTYLNALPGVDLDWQLDINALTVSNLNLTQASVTLVRTSEQGTLTAHAKGADGGLLDLQLTANIFTDKPTRATLRTDFSRFNIPKLFQQTSAVIDSRTSGSINFSSHGTGLEQIFAAMKGKADLSFDFRADHDWKRAPTKGEQMQVSGEAALVLENKRIIGLQISNLAIDSVVQNLTGNLSMVVGRKPWMEANLTSDKLDLTGLAKLKPQDVADGAAPDLLGSFKHLGENRITLNAKSLLVDKTPLNKVTLLVSTAPNSIKIEQLDFSLEQGRLTSQGEINWLKDEATLSLDTRVDGISLDKFLVGAPPATNTPLSGTISLHSTGNTVSSLLAGLTGDIQLATGPGGGGSSVSSARGQIDMTARQTADGMHAVIRRFLWEGTDLAGSVLYRNTTPPLLEVELSGGSLSLIPWETAKADETPNASKKDKGSIVTRTARGSAGLIGNIAMAPLRLISGPREAKPGDKLFSTTPLPFDLLNKYQARVKGTLDTLTSRKGNASDITFSANLIEGQLAIETSAGTLNEGSASGKITIDAREQPASVVLHGTFRNLRENLVKTGSPRSGYFDISSHGQSQADLAANINGLVYLELGAGPLDYSNSILLTADVTTGVFETLIPGADKTQPQLECAVALGVFKDGMGSTPYGYAARTDRANLVGRFEIDLKKELLHLNFSSSSRKGLGLSVGNVFSNTVEVEGPLTDPKIIPNTTGLLWRSWAAVMTGGLSMVGESVMKRALASENPCVSVQKHIRKDLCVAGQAAASSSLICPPS